MPKINSFYPGRKKQNIGQLIKRSAPHNKLESMLVRKDLFPPTHRKEIRFLIWQILLYGKTKGWSDQSFFSEGSNYESTVEMPVSVSDADLESEGDEEENSAATAKYYYIQIR